MSLLSFKDIMASNSFLAMLGMGEFNVSKTDLIFHLNPMPTGCGSLGTIDPTAYTMSRLECRFTTGKFKSFLRIASSELVHICFD
jgi:hypothetical protein